MLKTRIFPLISLQIMALILVSLVPAADTCKLMKKYSTRFCKSRVDTGNCEQWKTARLWKCNSKADCRETFKNNDADCSKTYKQARKDNWNGKEINIKAIGECFSETIEEHRECSSIVNEITEQMMTGVKNISDRTFKNFINR